MPFRFRNPTFDDARMLLAWRRRPEISRHMTTEVEDDMDKQRAWLARCEARPDYIHFIVLLEEDDRPVGYFSYSAIDWQARSCTTGFYLVLEPRERARAAFLADFTTDYAFFGLEMKTLNFGVLSDNRRLLARLAKSGMTPGGVAPAAVVKEGRALDMHLFAETREGYIAGKRRHFTRERTLAAFPPRSHKFVPPPAATPSKETAAS